MDFKGKKEDQPWGWSIVYDSEDDGVVEDCKIIVNGADCTIKENQVGTATILSDSLTIEFSDHKYKSGDYDFTYNMYAGECIGSDNGNLLTTGICCAEDVAQYARVPENYPLTSGTISSNSFTFSDTIKPRSQWGSDYKVFPIGEKDRMYLTGHVKICEASR